MHFVTLPAAEDSDVAVAAPSDDATAALLGLAPPTGVGDTANSPSDSCAHSDSVLNDYGILLF